MNSGALLMIRMHLLVPAVLACAAAVAAAQSPENPPKTKEPKPLTLVGCVTADEDKTGQYTFEDVKDGTTYRLSGADASAYVGKRVQIVGATDSKRIKVRTGLAPSPNVAGQAGAIDPAQAAMAAQGATTRGTGTGELPEFKVKAVKQVKGKCPGNS